MTAIIIQFAAAAYLLSSPWFITAHKGRDKFFFKVIPTLLGFALGAQAYGQFMGWPI